MVTKPLMIIFIEEHSHLVGGHGGGSSSHSLVRQSARILDFVENFQSIHGAMLFGIFLVGSYTGVLNAINFTSKCENNFGGHPTGFDFDHGVGNSTTAQFVQKLNWVLLRWTIRHFHGWLGFLSSH